MPIQAYESALQLRGEPHIHLTAALDSDAKPHPIVITYCQRRIPITEGTFIEAAGKMVCSGCGTAKYDGRKN